MHSKARAKNSVEVGRSSSTLHVSKDNNPGFNLHPFRYFISNHGADTTETFNPEILRFGHLHCFLASHRKCAFSRDNN